jgi:hypothetical protein
VTHPADSQLALFAGGDLPVLHRWRVQRHLSGCDYCRREIEALRGARDHVRGANIELPRGYNWDRLAAEMTANIRLGLEAGECVASQAMKPDRLRWRAVGVMAAMTCILLAAWWLNPAPERQPVALRQPQVEIRTTASGIQLNENGGALTLLHTRGRQKPIIVSAPGTLRARFIDSETGQVTINNVYAQ